MKKNYYLVDYAKLFFAICVFSIHCDLISNFYIVNLLFRLAVPFFFVTSGFFLERKISDRINVEKKIYSYINRIFRLLIIFYLVFVLMNGYTRIVINHDKLIDTLKYFIWNFFFYGSNGLWYLKATIVALLIAMPFVKKGKLNIIFIISFFFYLLAVSLDTYYSLIHVSFFQQIHNSFYSLFPTIRSGLLIGLFMLSFGMKSYDIYTNVYSKTKPLTKEIFMVISLFIYFFEVVITKNLIGFEGKQFYITSPLIAVEILFMLLDFSKKNVETGMVRSLSILLFLTHVPIMSMIDFLFVITTGNSCPSQLIYYVVCLLSSLIISTYIYKCKKLNSFIFK